MRPSTRAGFGLIGLAFLASGCWVIGPFVVPVPIARPGPPAPNVPPTPVLPTIYLEYAGNRVTPVEQIYQWHTGNAGYSGSGAASPSGPLAVPAGDSLDIVINYATAPAVLWVAELDSQGAPIVTSALTPTSNATPYRPSRPGPYRLQVTAEWTYQNFMSGVFDLNVQP